MDELRITHSGQRLDKWLASDSMSRSRAAALIQQGHVSVNGKVVTKSSFLPDIGDMVAIDVPDMAETVDTAEDIPLRILYEDDALAVVDKPCGMVVHPAAGNQSGTLVNALLYHLDSLSGIGGERRPGIVHRLDKDTSGLLIVAKDDRAHAALSRQLAERKMEKHYLAVVAGQMKEPEGRIDLPIGRSPKDRKKMAVHPDGRSALTEWRVLDQRPDRALLDVRLITGRTHQIRVHMAALHHPVLGDPLYGVRGMPAAPRLMLHAWRLAFAHPVTGETLRLTAEPDSIFALPKEVEPWR